MERIMSKINLEYVKRDDIVQLSEEDLELASGGMRSLGDVIHRLLFAADCVLSGNTLSVKGDQLHCTL
jgi:hypothetical protein